ncbi:hypothetical protein OFAG_02297 [Oxalobacter formigenes HOxBLS]|uniref:Uncharacterized protein n=1 Tax=Oxalobacter paraformigenes TaxID=556268 RepID=T5LSV3_9BURK|nr:hypothetical protein OFAG_02297 [Oxalobacter paraformigenes]
MPGKYYIYIPFDTKNVTQLQDAALKWRENRLTYRNDSPDGKTPNLIRHGIHKIPEKIRESPDQYTLYILAHCNTTTISNINYVWVRERETLSFSKYPSPLKTPKNPASIPVWCWSIWRARCRIWR